MASIDDIRKQYPQYADMSDVQLADALHQKYYPDMAKADFYGKVGVGPEFLPGNVPEPQNPSKWQMAASLLQNVPGVPLPVKAMASAVGDPSGSARTAIDQITQGGTFGFGDELIDKAVTPNVAKTLDIPESDAYNLARQMSKEQLAKEWQDHPGIALASQALGGYGPGKLATKGIGAITNTALGTAGRAGTVGKALQNIAATEGIGAAYGAGTADDGDRGSGAARGALTASLVSRGVPLAASLADDALTQARNAYRGFFAQSPAELDNTLEQMGKKTSASYQAMRNAGATFTPQTQQDIVNSVGQELANSGKINSTLHAGTISALSDLSNEAQKGTLDLESLDQYRQLFSAVKQNATEVNGNVKPDGKMASVAIRAIDNAIGKLGAGDISNPAALDALNQGRADYAKMARFRDVAGIVQKSDGDANVLKRNLQNFADKGKKLSGWNSDELNALNEAATNSTSEKLLKQTGKFGIDLGGSKTPGNVAIPALTVMGAESFGGPEAAAKALPVVVGGTAARYAQKNIAAAKAQALLDLLSARGDQNTLAQLMLQQQAPSQMLRNTGNQSSLIYSLLSK